VEVTGNNKNNGLQAKKQKPGKSEIAQIGLIANTTRWTGTSSKTQLTTRESVTVVHAITSLIGGARL
jgi:hypothetical protein